MFQDLIKKLCSFICQVAREETFFWSSSHGHRQQGAGQAVALLDFHTWFRYSRYFACLHDRGFFGGSAFIQPIRTIWKVFKKLWLAGKKPLLFWSYKQANRDLTVLFFGLFSIVPSGRGLIVLFFNLFCFFS